MLKHLLGGMMGRHGKTSASVILDRIGGFVAANGKVEGQSKRFLERSVGFHCFNQMMMDRGGILYIQGQRCRCVGTNDSFLAVRLRLADARFARC